MLLTGNDVNRWWSTDRASCDVVEVAPSKPAALDIVPYVGVLPYRRAFGRPPVAVRVRWPIDVTCRSGKG